jgi:hypothetical protein
MTSATGGGFTLPSIPLSPHPHLLVSGVPSESEAKAIQEAIDIANHSILAIAQEMDRLNHTLNEQSAIRRAYQEFNVGIFTASKGARRDPRRDLPEFAGLSTRRIARATQRPAVDGN